MESEKLLGTDLIGLIFKKWSSAMEYVKVR